MPRPPRKNTLAPIEDDQYSTEEPEVDSYELTEESNMDSYISQPNGLKTDDVRRDYSEKDAEIAVLNEKIEVLEKEKEGAFSDNKILLDKIECLMRESGDSKLKELREENDKLRKRTETLQNEADTLLLKNSELEFENARLTETLKNAQSKIDAKLHTYTKSGYSNVKTVANRASGFVPSMNGYQDWR